MTTDHNWGLCIRIFPSERDITAYRHIEEALKRQPPDSFLGYAITDVTGT